MLAVAKANRNASLIENLADQIHARVVAGAYKPGERLKQEALAEDFGVSRTPIREALSRLNARGILKQDAGRSFVICTPQPRELREMYQVRAQLEGLAAELAAQWISDEQLDDLRLAHDAFVKATKRLRSTKGSRTGKNDAKEATKATAEWSDTNGTFHRIIMEASGNASLSRILQEVTTGYFQTIIMMSSMDMPMHRVAANIGNHAAILSAIEEHDPSRARKAMANHIAEGGAFVTSWFERQDIRGS